MSPGHPGCKLLLRHTKGHAPPGLQGASGANGLPGFLHGVGRVFDDGCKGPGGGLLRQARPPASLASPCVPAPRLPGLQVLASQDPEDFYSVQPAKLLTPQQQSDSGHNAAYYRANLVTAIVVAALTGCMLLLYFGKALLFVYRCVLHAVHDVAPSPARSTCCMLSPLPPATVSPRPSHPHRALIMSCGPVIASGNSTTLNRQCSIVGPGTVAVGMGIRARHPCLPTCACMALRRCRGPAEETCICVCAGACTGTRTASA